MGQKSINKDGVIYTKIGHVLKDTRDSSNNKTFAVIARCGHCGDGYFVPIMFSVFAKDLNSAIEAVRSYPRVKSHKKDFIIDAFELSEPKAQFVEAINDTDPYLNGYAVENDKITLQRRVAHEPKAEYDYRRRSNIHQKPADDIRTAEEYDEVLVLERFCAPFLQGENYIYPKSINREAFLYEYFHKKAYKFGIQKSRPHILSYYYQIYGENNDLNIWVDHVAQMFVCRCKDGRLTSIEIPDRVYQAMIKSGCFDKKPKVEETVQNDYSDTEKTVRVPSGLERFKRKYPNLVKPEDQPGN